MFRCKQSEQAASVPVRELHIVLLEVVVVPTNNKSGGAILGSTATPVPIQYHHGQTFDFFPHHLVPSHLPPLTSVVVGLFQYQNTIESQSHQHLSANCQSVIMLAVMASGWWWVVIVVRRSRSRWCCCSRTTDGSRSSRRVLLEEEK